MSVPTRDVVKSVQEARRSSEFLRAVKKAKSAFSLLEGKPADLKKAGWKPLTPAQVKALKGKGNCAEDWKRVWVGAGFDPDRVSRCTFHGTVLISGAAGSVEIDGAEFRRALTHTTFSSCVVGRDACVRNVRLVHRAVIGDGAVLFDVGAVTTEKDGSFANGTELAIAIETGGREVPIFAEMTVDDAWRLSRSRGDIVLLKAYADELAAYVREATAPCSVIGAGAKILHTPKVANVFLGEGAVIDNAQQVKDVTVLSAKGEETEISHGAIVKSSILQWGSEVTSEAIVDTSLLTEHSHVERHGKVTHSLLGPNTGVAEGEVTSALLGPFVGFHHQSLLIAAFWPEGKGNVGYGANVGSNHTAKAPDQEIWPGEGTFFGLGVNIKFPSDLTGSPYTIIASGVASHPRGLARVQRDHAGLGALRQHLHGQAQRGQVPEEEQGQALDVRLRGLPPGDRRDDAGRPQAVAGRLRQGGLHLQGRRRAGQELHVRGQPQARHRSLHLLPAVLCAPGPQAGARVPRLRAQDGGGRGPAGALKLQRSLGARAQGPRRGVPRRGAEGAADDAQPTAGKDRGSGAELQGKGRPPGRRGDRGLHPRPQAGQGRRVRQRDLGRHREDEGRDPAAVEGPAVRLAARRPLTSIGTRYQPPFRYLVQNGCLVPRESKFF
ncbi:MAG: DUF4954 family protein [Candidatus Omnitrophica bacterium]|nr:DUF4954 family protein [Candidatus Omnitrophota bacterium]